MVEGALQGVFMLLTLIVVGVVLAKTGFISEEMEDKLARLTLLVFIPCNLFLNSFSYMSAELLRDMGNVLWLPMAVMLPGYLLGYPIAALFKIPSENRGLFRVMFGLSNAIFIGLPVCLSIFGERAMPVVTIYFFSNTLLFWTVGVAGIASDAGRSYSFSLRTVAKIFSPPLIGALLGAVLALLGLGLPGFLVDSVRYLGGMNVPVSLLLTGAVLSRMGREVLRLGREAALTLVGRLLIQPGLMLAACMIFRTLGFMDRVDASLVTGVFVVEAAMPVMNQSMLMARVYGANSRLAAQMLTLTTLVSVVWIPVLVSLMEVIPGLA